MEWSHPQFSIFLPQSNLESPLRVFLVPCFPRDPESQQADTIINYRTWCYTRCNLGNLWAESWLLVASDLCAAAFCLDSEFLLVHQLSATLSCLLSVVGRIRKAEDSP